MNQEPSRKGLSRRDFFKGLGAATVTTTATANLRAAVDELQKLNAESPQGPAPVPVSLRINGSDVHLNLEPRTTLLDVLRSHLPLTGAKEGCDRASCGACTVLAGDVPVYACMMLAIDAQGIEVTTVEGLGSVHNLTPVQKCFVECDGLMCGYCTPGFVMSVTALLRKTPSPTEAEVRKACSGNLCRCGAYPRIFEAALKAAGISRQSSLEVIDYGGMA